MELEMGELTDPRDFPSRFAFARDVDRELRCSICVEFLDGAVSLPCCGVAFCSLCLRSALAAGEAKCPNHLCRKPTSESSIRPIASINKLVDAWKTGRKELLTILQNHELASSQKPETNRDNDVIGPKLAAMTQKVRKTEATHSNTPLNEVSDVVTIPATIHVVPTPAPSSLNESIIESPILPSSSVIDQRKMDTILVANIRDSSHAKVDVQTDRCIVCGAKISPSRMARHVEMHFAAEDREIRGKEKEKKRRSESVDLEGVDVLLERKPLPKLNYHIMQMKEIKTRCEALKLNTNGKKDKLIWRHRTYTLLYNANLDAANPKGEDELRIEVKRKEGGGSAESGEISVGSQARFFGSAAKEFSPSTSTTQRDENCVGHRINKKSDPNLIEKVLKDYETSHQNQFTDLIVKAKKAMRESKEVESEKRPSKDNESVVVGEETGDELTTLASETNDIPGGMEAAASADDPSMRIPEKSVKGKTLRGRRTGDKLDGKLTGTAAKEKRLAEMVEKIDTKCLEERASKENWSEDVVEKNREEYLEKQALEEKRIEDIVEKSCEEYLEKQALEEKWIKDVVEKSHEEYLEEQASKEKLIGDGVEESRREYLAKEASFEEEQLRLLFEATQEHATLDDMFLPSPPRSKKETTSERPNREMKEDNDAVPVPSSVATGDFPLSSSSLRSSSTSPFPAEQTLLRSSGDKKRPEPDCEDDDDVVDDDLSILTPRHRITSRPLSPIDEFSETQISKSTTTRFDEDDLVSLENEKDNYDDVGSDPTEDFSSNLRSNVDTNGSSVSKDFVSNLRLSPSSRAKPKYQYKRSLSPIRDSPYFAVSPVKRQRTSMPSMTISSMPSMTTSTTKVDSSPDIDSQASYSNAMAVFGAEEDRWKADGDTNDEDVENLNPASPILFPSNENSLDSLDGDPRVECDYPANVVSTGPNQVPHPKVSLQTSEDLLEKKAKKPKTNGKTILRLSKGSSFLHRSKVMGDEMSYLRREMMENEEELEVILSPLESGGEFSDSVLSKADSDANLSGLPISSPSPPTSTVKSKPRIRKKVVPFVP